MTPFLATRGGGGILCEVKCESTNSGATKPVAILKNERTKCAGLAKVAHEKQWTTAVISWRAFLVHQPALFCTPWNAMGTLQNEEGPLQHFWGFDSKSSCMAQGSNGTAERIAPQILKNTKQIVHKNFAQNS